MFQLMKSARLGILFEETKPSQVSPDLTVTNFLQPSAVVIVPVARFLGTVDEEDVLGPAAVPVAAGASDDAVDDDEALALGAAFDDLATDGAALATEAAEAALDATGEKGPDDDDTVAAAVGSPAAAAEEEKPTTWAPIPPALLAVLETTSAPIPP